MSARALGAARLLGDHKAGSLEWVAARQGRLGASEIAAALGLSKWQSPFSLFHLKAGNIAPEADNREMEWGRDLETLIARRFARNHPEWRLSRCGLYVNRERDYQVAQPDRTIHFGDRRLGSLEIKTDRNADEWGAEGTDEVPVYYHCQGLWQLDTFGWERCHVAVLIAGSDYREYLIRYDETDISIMREAAQEFLASVATGVPPDIDSHDATYRAVRELHPEIDGTEIEIGVELADEYLAALTGFDEAEAVKQLAISRVAATMGNARRAVCNKQRIAIRIPGRNGSAPYLKSSIISKGTGKVAA